MMILPVLAAQTALLQAAVPGPPDMTRHFDSLVAEIGSLRSDLEEIGRRERSVLNELERLDVEASLHARELDRLAILKTRTDAERERTERELTAVRDRVASSEEALARQLRETYTRGRLRELRMFLALENPADLMRGVTYVNMAAGRQAGLVESLRRDHESLESLEVSLLSQSGRLEDLQRKGWEESRRLDLVRQDAEEILRATRREAEAHGRAIAELTRAAEELEQVIVSMQGPGEEGASLALDAIPLDIGKLRGTLRWPVPGEVAVPFGDISHPRFGTRTPHPGIDIRTDPGTPIRAVLAGRVVYSRRFPGYGNTVLVDHGGRYLSVYAGAAVLEVDEGQQVLAGDPIGTSGDLGLEDGRPSIYFEFRHEGRALDPADWLKRMGNDTGERDR